MSSPLKQNTTTIQELLSTINSLPEAGTELPELSNEGSASDMLSGKQLIDGDGNIVTGTIATKTASNLTASGATVTVPAGYYPSAAEKSVSAASRASTTLSVTADDTADTLKIDASNNQSTGYVTGSNQTATTTVTLTASGATVTATETGGKKVSKSVATATQATPSVNIDANGLITASATQTAGYVSAGTKSATKQLTTQAAKTITPSTSSQTAVASGVYATGAVTVAAMPTATQATPSISVNSSGLITASATQTAGYVSAGTKSATQQLTTQDAQTITPGTSDKTIASGKYLTGTQTIKGDANLVAGNIKSGVSIFGVTGTVETGVDTTDATASAGEIFLNETAYVNGNKVTGTFTIDGELDGQASLIAQIKDLLQTKALPEASGGTSLGDDIDFLTVTNFSGADLLLGGIAIANGITRPIPVNPFLDFGDDNRLTFIVGLSSSEVAITASSNCGFEMAITETADGKILMISGLMTDDMRVEFTAAN